MQTLTLNKSDLKDRKVFFTSDLHLSHNNIIKLCNRPFDSVYEMNKILTNNWNQVINHDDLVFILGDFCFGDKIIWQKILSELNGKKYLILGNHDKIKNIPHEKFELVCDMLQLWVENNQNKHDQFFLCHYPILSFPGMFRGVNHFYGHVHTRDNHIGGGPEKYLNLMHPRSYDVGVDGNNFTPIELNNLLKIIEKKCLN